MSCSVTHNRCQPAARTKRTLFRCQSGVWCTGRKDILVRTGGHDLRAFQPTDRSSLTRPGKHPARPVPVGQTHRLNSSFDGLTTQGRVHTLSLPCEKAVRLVKMGFINKNLGVQYCHHLIQLSKHESGTDKDFYASEAFDLTHFLMRQGRELVESAKINLLVDMSSIDPTYCARACELVLNSERILDVSHPQSQGEAANVTGKLLDLSQFCPLAANTHRPWVAARCCSLLRLLPRVPVHLRPLPLMESPHRSMHLVL